MYSQQFTAKELYRFVNQRERLYWKKRKNIDGKDLQEHLNRIVTETVNKGEYKFVISHGEKAYLNGHKKGSLAELALNVLLRKLSENVKRTGYVRQADRNAIVSQVIGLLQESGSHYVIRLDIRHFYESIPRNQLMKRLKETTKLNSQSLSLLEEMMKCCGSEGVPRGLGPSAILSEFYMKYFDLEVRRMEGVYYEARFVDDIIVFCTTKESMDNVYEQIKTLVEDYGMVLNEEKTMKWTGTESDVKVVNVNKKEASEKKNISKNLPKLTYLGYEFEASGKVLKIHIARNKVNKIKTRLVRSVINYGKNKDESLLMDRIKYLTGNFSIIDKKKHKHVKVGIFYNYKYINVDDEVKELDVFYRKLIYAGKRSKIRTIISSSKKERLLKYSFAEGYRRKISHGFTFNRIKDIKACWL